jgi:uncharacterized glyoxalase superfamily protein PhnB
MRVLYSLLLAALVATPATTQSKEKPAMSVKKLTPVLLVPEIEPCLKFWVDRLGFAKTIEVPDGSKLGFVTLQKGSVELMYQTYSSVEKDSPSALQGVQRGPTFLYVEVESLDATLAAMKGVPLSMPVRTTFYGAKEFGVKDPAGHSITFAQFAAPPQQ